MPEPRESDIGRREAELKARHPRVMACRAWVEDRQLLINREHDDDPLAALREAFAAADRELDALQSGSMKKA